MRNNFALGARSLASNFRPLHADRRCKIALHISLSRRFVSGITFYPLGLNHCLTSTSRFDKKKLTLCLVSTPNPRIGIEVRPFDWNIATWTQSITITKIIRSIQPLLRVISTSHSWGAISLQWTRGFKYDFKKNARSTAKRGSTSTTLWQIASFLGLQAPTSIFVASSPELLPRGLYRYEQHLSITKE